jgi:hypothetical protein
LPRKVCTPLCVGEPLARLAFRCASAQLRCIAVRFTKGEAPPAITKSGHKNAADYRWPRRQRSIEFAHASMCRIALRRMQLFKTKRTYTAVSRSGAEDAGANRLILISPRSQRLCVRSACVGIRAVTDSTNTRVH